MGVRLGWLRIQTLAVLAMSGIFALFVAQGGGRRTVGVMIGMALILWLLLQKKVGARGFVVVSLAVVGVLSLMQFMLEYRNVGFGAVGTEMVVIGAEGPRVLRVEGERFLEPAGGDEPVRGWVRARPARARRQRRDQRPCRSTRPTGS